MLRCKELLRVEQVTTGETTSMLGLFTLSY